MTTLSYKNPLDDFASYSVHYIMLATRTTEDARVFTDEGQNADTLAAIDKVKLIGDLVPYAGSSSAYLVIDTRRFSQFTIEKLKYDVRINGLSVGQSHANIKQDIELTVLDSVGISFINFLQWLINEKMQTNFSGMVFMLRVIFVGHHPDGSTETVQSLTIPLRLSKAELNLDFSKGVYTLALMPYTNFDAFSPERWLNIANATQYFTGAGKDTLGDIVSSLEQRLNEQSERYFQRASALLRDVGTRQQNKYGGYGRLVRYQITLPADWEPMKFTGGGTANSTESIYQKVDKAVKDKAGAPIPVKPGEPKDVHTNVPVGLRITEVLDLIFKQVKGISDLGSANKRQGEGGSITFYKHLVSLTSDDEVVTVHVDVVPFKVPNVYLEKKDTIAQDQDHLYQIVDGVRVPKQYFEFDYIFTGKNTQILNFDIKFQDFSVFLRSNLGLGADSLEVITATGQKGTVDPNQKIDTTGELVMGRAFDPILLPLNTEAEITNFTQYSQQLMAQRGKEFKQSSQDYTRNLSVFYARTPVQTTMLIKGNPLIMSKFTITDFVPKVGTSAAKGPSSKETYRKEFEAKILKKTTGEFRQEGSTFVLSSPLEGGSYTTGPVFFKINIKGPNVNYTTSETVHGEEFSKEILYQTYYKVMSISSVIESGNFTQQLELWGHNAFGQAKTGAPDGDTKDPKTLK